MPLRFLRLDDPTNRGTLRAELADLHRREIIATEPGDLRSLTMLRQVAADAGIALEVREDRHYLCRIDGFRAHAQDRKQLRLEYFYRQQRRRHGVLMDGDAPCGGAWNYHSLLSAALNLKLLDPREVIAAAEAA